MKNREDTFCIIILSSDDISHMNWDLVSNLPKFGNLSLISLMKLLLVLFSVAHCRRKWISSPTTVLHVYNDAAYSIICDGRYFYSWHFTYIACVTKNVSYHRHVCLDYWFWLCGLFFLLHFITRKYIINCYFTAKKRSNNDWWPLNQDWWPLSRDSVYEWTVVWVTVIKCQLCVQEWVSDCCLTPTQQFFSYIIAKTN